MARDKASAFIIGCRSDKAVDNLMELTRDGPFLSIHFPYLLWTILII